MREKLPDRRHSWLQKVRIGGQTFHMNFGEYADGRLGEVFLDAAKEGTFIRGMLGSLARMVSVALQSGASPADVVHALRGLNFPPCGLVEMEDGESAIKECSSVPDFLARLIEEVYCQAWEPTQAVKVAGAPLASRV